MTHTVRNRPFGLWLRFGAEADSSCHPRRQIAATRTSSAPAIATSGRGTANLCQALSPPSSQPPARRRGALFFRAGG